MYVSIPGIPESKIFGSTQHRNNFMLGALWR